MNRITQPSPALIVAVLALVAALAGTALAANPTGQTSALNKKKVKKIAKKQINKLAPGLSVAHADTASAADTAEAADTANRATQAQNATTANRVRPVKVNFAVPANTPETPLLNQGGVRITGDCGGTGTTHLHLTTTANNGLVKLDVVNANHTGSSTSVINFDPGTFLNVDTGAADPANNRTVTLAYRSAGGATVTGNLLLGQGTAAAQCVIAGTLFVG